MGAYGVTPALAPELDVERNIATGGTLFGNPLSAAAARAALTEVLVPQAYVHAAAAGARLADGIADAIADRWTCRGPRSDSARAPASGTGRNRVRVPRRTP